jgi:hypothetical protein
LRPFDHHAFTAQAGLAVGLGVGAFASALSTVGPAIDQQRIREQSIIDARVVRARCAVSRRRAELALATIDARDELRRAAEAYAARGNS